MELKIILIHPPVSIPSEPPAGLARLAGCLQANGIDYQLIDTNLEGILYLLAKPAAEISGNDRWTTRARKHAADNLAALRDGRLYQNESRYQRTVKDINRLLTAAGKNYHIDLTLADYRDRELTPVKSRDLIYAAEHPELNPFYPYFSERLRNALKAEPEFIGFSLNYLSQALCTFAMIGFIKRENPRQKIILGGSLTTSWIKSAGNNHIFTGLVYKAVAGVGERKLLDLLGRNDGRISGQPNYRDFLLNNYLSPVSILPYSTAQGCYWHQCSFCPEKAEDNPYQPQPVNQVLADLQELSQKLHPGLIHLLDNALSPVMLGALTQNNPGAPWYGFTRITHHLTAEDFCRSLRRNGCVMLKLGIESGDQEVLDKLNKGIDLPTVLRALKAIKQAGIATYVYLLFGTPPENETSAMKTLSFVVNNSAYIDFLNLAIFNLPILSMETQNLATSDFYDGDLSLYKDFVHPLGWQRSSVRNFLEKTFKRHPAVTEILRRTPHFFTSNHAPFFILNSLNK